ncbi:hypothetical protein D3C73_795750 [compost metagenome]
MQRQIPFGHAFYEGIDSRFIVVGSERSRQPQAESPCRRQRRLAGKGGIFSNNLLNGRSLDDKVLQALACYAELGFFHFFRSDFIRNQFRVVNKYAVAFACYVERNVLVGLLGAGAAIFIPDVYHLSVFDKSGKAFAQTIDEFAYAEIQLFTHERVAVLVCNVGHRFETAAGNTLVAPVKVHGPVSALVDHHTKPAADQHGLCFGFFNLDMIAGSLG